jgi:hypothetical protein
MKGTITFNMGFNSIHFNINVDIEGTLTEPLAPKIPNRPRYKFKYWGTDPNGGTTYTTQQLETPKFFATTANPTIILYGIWESQPTP